MSPGNTPRWSIPVQIGWLRGVLQWDVRRQGRWEGPRWSWAAIREIITRAVVGPPKFINERRLKVTLKLHGRTSAVSFVVAYGPTEYTRDESKKRTFWAALDRAVKDVPKHEGVGRPENEHCGALGAYSRDTRNAYVELLLACLLYTSPSPRDS